MEEAELLEEKADEWRVSDAAGGGVTRKAASGAQRSKARIGPSGESGLGVNRKGSPVHESSMSSAVSSQMKWKAVVRKESAETLDYVSLRANNEMEITTRAWRSWVSSRAR